MNKKNLKMHHVSLQMPNQESNFFQNINLEFSPGIYFVTGKNGIGKSTLFRLINGSLLPGETTSGSIELNGTIYSYNNHNVLPNEYIKKIRHIVQKTDTMLVQNFSCEENLQFALLSHRPFLKTLPSHTPLPDFFFNLGIDLKKPINQLSGGQRQIISILMMLQKETTVLLLDEPTAALDQENAILLMEFITKLTTEQELIVLIITHDNDIINEYRKPNNCLIIKTDSDGKRIITVNKN